jgi:hypothetical protein
MVVYALIWVNLQEKGRYLLNVTVVTGNELHGWRSWIRDPSKLVTRPSPPSYASPSSRDLETGKPFPAAK